MVGAKSPPHHKGATLVSKEKRHRGIYIPERELLFSKAYLTLSGKAPQVYLIFLCKRKMVKLDRRKNDWLIENNGKITFTYREAEELGISRQTFARAIDQLIEHGFIDIAKTGAGLYKAATFYAISERWKKFGTPDFEVQRRKKRRKHFGFQRGHRDYRKHELK